MAAAHLFGPSVGGVSGVAPHYCQGKQRFASAIRAVQAWDRMGRKRPQHYRCPHCGSWHVGSVNIKDARRSTGAEHAARP